MSNDKKRITTTRVVFAIFLVGLIVAASITGYRYYRANRWVVVKESPDDWVLVNGELAQKNSAPCPQMVLKQGKVKFLASTTDGVGVGPRQVLEMTNQRLQNRGSVGA